jgi:hypothetical protein
VICDGCVAMISGLPLYSFMRPVAQILLSRYFTSGAPNFGRSLLKMTTVKIWFGYGLSRFRNVGWLRLEDKNFGLMTVPPNRAGFADVL